MKKKYKVLIISAVLVLCLLAVFITRSRSISVYPTKENCELATDKGCVFPVCGHIPKGANFKDVCGVDFKQGWITESDFANYADKLSTVFTSQEACETSTKTTCHFVDCSQNCEENFRKGWRPIQ